MINLDSRSDVESLDKGKIADSIRLLPKQFSQAWNEMQKVDLPNGLGIVQNVVICGMGGSGLGGRIVDSLVFDRARVSIEVFNEYKLPNYANKNTLVILYSYSGDTEETLSAASLALERSTKIFGITTGGKLSDFLKENNLPSYIFDPKFNPSGQPRMGLGYAIASIISILSKGAFIRLGDESDQIVRTAEKYIEEYDIENPKEKNIAKSLAQKIKSKIPIIFASEHLVGISHAFANQINENAKTFSAIFDIPEANHHLLEGLKFPTDARKLLTFIFIESNLYTKEVLKRYPITRDVLEKQGYTSYTYVTSSENKIEEIFEVLVLGSYISFYLAMLEGIDPGPIPTVDFFKEKLAK